MNVTRKTIELSPKKYLLKGKKRQADVYIIVVNGKRIVIKDYLYKKGLTKLYGKILAKREFSHYIKVNNLFDFFPQLYGMPDKYSIAIEYIDGKTFGDVEGKEEYCFAVEKLKECISKMHRSNIYHLDLRKRGNIIIKDEKIYLIDLASMIHLTQFSILNIFKPVFRLTDTSSVLKWKQFICPSSLTKEERKKLKQFQWIRALWFINKPKIPGKK